MSLAQVITRLKELGAGVPGVKTSCDVGDVPEGLDPKALPALLHFPGGGSDTRLAFAAGPGTRQRSHRVEVRFFYKPSASGRLRDNLAALGYAGAYVEVRVNPPGRVLEMFSDGVTPLPEEEGGGPGLTYFHKACSEILRETNLGGMDFSTPRAVLDSRLDGDPQVVEAALDFFFRRRRERAEAAKN